MGGLVIYQYKKFITAYQYIAPCMFFLTALIMLYFYSGQPILSSFASSAIILLFIMTWLTTIILNLENIEEQQLLFVQLNGKRKYILGKLVFSCLVSIPFILFAVAYPIVTMRFEQHLSVSNILFRNIHSHSISAIRNCFTLLLKVIQGLSQKYRWLVLVLIYLISILKIPLIQNFSILKFILWVFPPVSELLSVYNKDVSQLLNMPFAILNVWFALYICVLITLIFVFVSRTEYR